MARIRTIKPSFFINDDLAKIEPIGRILFVGLWTLADKAGRLEDRPARIKVEVLPFDSADVDNLLSGLEAVGFIERYHVDGRNYIQILNFAKHQRPHPREPESEIPERTKKRPAVKKNGQAGTGRVDKGKESLDKGKEIVEKAATAFDEFWKVFPKKKNQAAARSAWKSLNPSSDLVEKILFAIREQKTWYAWREFNGKYIPHPATWLHGRRWEDEKSPEDNNDGKQQPRSDLGSNSRVRSGVNDYANIGTKIDIDSGPLPADAVDDAEAGSETRLAEQAAVG